MRQSTEKRARPAILFPIFAACALAGLLPLRIWQELTRTDPKTGFWGQQSPTTGVWEILRFNESRSILLLYLGLAALILVPLLAGFALRKRSVLDFGRRPRKLEGTAALLLGAAMVVDAVAALRFAIDVYLAVKEGRFLSGMEPVTRELTFGVMLQYYTRTGTLAAVMQAFAGAAGAVFLLQFALLDWFPARKKDPSRLLALAPLVWTMCRVLRRFSRTISFVRVPDLLLDLLMLICLMIFFLAFAQLLSGIEGEGKEFRLPAAGIPAAVLCLCCFIPRVALYFKTGGSLPQDALIEWCDPAVALFIACCLGSRFLVCARTPAVAAPQKSTAAEESQEAETEKANAE